MKLVLVLLLLALAMPLALLASPAYAQIEIVEADPPDGSKLTEPPEVVHLCFSQPVKFRDSASFNFRYMMPDGSALGMRIVFRPGGECVDVYPGLPAVPSAGEYTFQWQVSAAEGEEEGSGTIRFKVGETSASTASPTPAPGETAPPETQPGGGTPGTAGGDDDDGPDILLLALLTTGSVGVAAVLFTLGYLLRRRIGYDPHRPPEGGEEGGGDH